MAPADLSRLHAVIEGRVQGVFFRVFVQETAITLAVTGWARNRWNGTVEVLAEGDRQSLDKLLAALHRGPQAAHVTRVTHEWGTATGEFDRFMVRATSI